MYKTLMNLYLTIIICACAIYAFDTTNNKSLKKWTNKKLIETQIHTEYWI